MANNLSVLAPTLFSAAKEVAKEPVGALTSINMSFDDKGVAKGDSVIVPVAPPASEGDYTPAMTTTEGDSKTAESIAVTIDYSKQVTWHLTGEQMRSLENGASSKEWVRQMVAQGMRTLRNAAESRLCAVIKAGASRAVGTAGTNPFTTNLDAIADVEKIFIDNGAPMSDPYLIINSSALNAAQKLSIVQQADKAGSDAERRQGILMKQYGFNIKTSAGIVTHVKGAGTGYDIVAAGEAVGQTILSLEGGTVNTTGIKAGDVVTFSGGTADANKYVVNTGLVATSGDIVIGRPGLLIAKVDADEMTIGDNYTPNIAFERSAVVGVWRPPLIPASPLINQLKISDDSGMTYLMCEILGDGEITWRLNVCYGFKVINSEFVAILMG